MKDRIDELFDAFTGDGRLGAVSAAVCTSERVIYEGASGTRSPGGDRMTVDSVGFIASMTKAVTGAAAMHCVERGLLDLDQPAGAICPYLGEAQVFDGFDENDTPVLRAPARPVTLRNLLTHSSGFVYDLWNPDAGKVYAKLGLPVGFARTKRSLEMPLMFDPDSRWEYGIGIDWAGQMVEAASGMTLGEYFREHITGPLGMTDTAFAPSESMAERLMVLLLRDADGGLVEPAEPVLPSDPPEFDAGGGGLFSSAADYIKFLQMILGKGASGGTRILEEATVAQMARNQMADLRVTMLPSLNKALSEDAEFFPGDEKSWGLTFQINEVPGFTGRSKGTLMWAGLTNCYYWVDVERDVAGVFLSQSLPFADPICLDAFFQFETLVYDAIG